MIRIVILCIEMNEHDDLRRNVFFSFSFLVCNLTFECEYRVYNQSVEYKTLIIVGS